MKNWNDTLARESKVLSVLAKRFSALFHEKSQSDALFICNLDDMR